MMDYDLGAADDGPSIFEHNPSVKKYASHARPWPQRIAVEEDQVGVSAGVYAAYSIRYAEHLGGRQCDGPQRGVAVEAVAHHFGDLKAQRLVAFRRVLQGAKRHFRA